MYLRAFGDEELRQWVERVSTWLSDDEKDKIASEFERTGLKALGPIEKTRKEEKARVEANKTTEKSQKKLEREWCKRGCITDSSRNWKVPYELIWRALPRGEDR